MKQLTAQDLIAILEEVESDTPIYLFNINGGLEDDQRKPLTEDDIDMSIDGIVDINIPENVLTSR